MTTSAAPAYDLIRQFLKDNVPQMKRISEGAVELIWTYVRLAIDHGIKINIDDEVYLEAAKARSMSRHYYTDIRDVCCNMKGYSNHITGTCDLIISWTPAFQSLVFNVLKAQIQHNRNIQLYMALKEFPNKYHINLTPGADITMYKHNPQKSARYYIGLQNIPKDMKSEIYKDYIDIDIVSCFPQIFWKEVLHCKSDNAEMRLMIEDGEAFLQKTIDDGVPAAFDAQNDRSGAKAARSRLFHPSSSINRGGERRAPRKTGIGWYDNLQSYIISKLREAGIENEHLFFTKKEQLIIDSAFDVIGRENVVLRMHDGAICKDLVEIEMLCDLLEIKTGYRFSWKKL